MRDRKYILSRIFMALFVMMVMVLFPAVCRFAPENFNAVVDGL